MIDKFLESQLRKRSTKFEGISIKQYTLKSFYDCLFLYRLKRQLESRLKQLQEKYAKGKIDKKTLIQMFNSIIDYLINTEIKLYSYSLLLDHKRNNFVYKKIQKTITKNYKKYLIAILNPKKHILLLSEYKKIKFTFFITHPITFWKVKRKAIIIDDTYNDLLMEILIFNYPEMFFKNDNDNNDNETNIETKSDVEIKNGYIEILSMLSKRFSKDEIDNFYMDEIKILVSNIEREKYIEYLATHFMGVRYSTIAQSSFKNDESGSKRSAELQKIVEELISNASGKKPEKPKSELMSKMEIEAMKVLEKLEKSKQSEL